MYQIKNKFKSKIGDIRVQTSYEIVLTKKGDSETQEKMYHKEQHHSPHIERNGNLETPE